MPDDRTCLGPPRCRYTVTEGVRRHEPGCPMLSPPPKIERDPMRLAHPVAAVTGGGETWTPYAQDYNTVEPMGPDSFGGEDFPAPGEMPTMTLAEAGLPPALIAWHDNLREQANKTLGLPITMAPMDVVKPLPIYEQVMIDVQRRALGMWAIGKRDHDPDPLRAAYGALLDCVLDVRRVLKARDGQ